MVAVLLDSAASGGGDIRERAMAMLADLASSDAARPNQAQEAGAVVPQLCRALDSGSGAASVEHASTGMFRRKRVC